MREGTGKGGLRFLVEAKLVETSDRKRDFEIWARGGEACPPPISEKPCQVSLFRRKERLLSNTWDGAFCKNG